MLKNHLRAILFFTSCVATSWAQQDSVEEPLNYKCSALGKASEPLEIKDFRLQISDQEVVLSANDKNEKGPRVLNGTRNQEVVPEKNSGYVNFAGFDGELSLEVEQDLIQGGYQLVKGGNGGIVKLRKGPNLFQPYLCRSVSKGFSSASAQAI